MKQFRPRLSEKQFHIIKQYKKDRNILVIGDLHEPFCLDDYLEFNVNLYEQYYCNEVVFIGDVIDSHYSSFHDTDPDGLGGGDEFDLALKRLSAWNEYFPKAKVCLGNHDLIIRRKAFSGGIPKAWIKEFSDALNVPEWDFKPYFDIDNVHYVHGVGRKAKKRRVDDMMSVVCGHTHTEVYCDWGVGQQFKTFAMQVGCGIDHASYAMAYGKEWKKPVIGSGLVLENGTHAFNKLMNL